MALHYDPDTYTEAKRLFILDGKSPRDISAIFNNKPTHQTIARWAKQKDENGQSWFDSRQDALNERYEKLSHGQIANKLYDQIEMALQRDDVSADKIIKLVKSIEKLTDPKYHIPTMYHFLTEMTQYFKDHHPELMTEQFLKAIRDFKNHLRSQISG